MTDDRAAQPLDQNLARGYLRSGIEFSVQGSRSRASTFGFQVSFFKWMVYFGCNVFKGCTGEATRRPVTPSSGSACNTSGSANPLEGPIRLDLSQTRPYSSQYFPNKALSVSVFSE